MKQQVYDYYIDASTTRTGIVLLGKDEIIITDLDFSKIKSDKKKSKVENQFHKFQEIKKILDKFVEKYPCNRIFLEGIFVKPAFLNSSEVVIKFHGFLMLYFIDKELAYYPPKSVKKEVIGNGNASKEDVYQFIKEQFSIECKNYDQSDALSLLIYEHKIHDKEISLHMCKFCTFDVNL